MDVDRDPVCNDDCAPERNTLYDRKPDPHCICHTECKPIVDPITDAVGCAHRNADGFGFWDTNSKPDA